MRLIDADSLKEALKANCGTLCNDKNTDWCEYCCPHNDFEDLIDNAPTADESDIQAVLNKRCMTIVTNEYLIALHDKRPKGEWIVGEYMDCHSDILPKYTCPFCGEVAYRKYDFCHCGADMRVKDELKEAENEQ